jgi:hypothetical protein
MRHRPLRYAPDGWRQSSGLIDAASTNAWSNTGGRGGRPLPVEVSVLKGWPCQFLEADQLQEPFRGNILL